MFASPKDAASLVLLRKNNEPHKLEVLLTQRSRSLAFVPGCYVFPGGTLDEEDYHPAVWGRCLGITLEGAQRILGEPDNPRSLSYWVIAIRELFEEVGLLIACRENGEMVRIETSEERRRFSAYQKLMLEGKLTMSELMKRENLYYPMSELYYLSRFITPSRFPRRYDARFFFAKAPSCQSVNCQSAEVIDSIWISPQEALAGWRAGKLPLIYPTITVLEYLAPFRSFEELLAEHKGLRGYR